MIDIPSNDPRLLALKAAKYEWAGLVRIDFKSGVAHLSPTTVNDIEVDGQMWMGNCDMLNISPVSAERAPLDSRDVHSITFADPIRDSNPRRWLDLFVDGGSYIGIPIWVGIAFLRNGSWTESFTLYRGRCIGVSAGVGPTGGQITTATFSGPLVRLDSNPQIVLTRSNLARRNSSDNFLDFVSTSRNLPFGKLART